MVKVPEMFAMLHKRLSKSLGFGRVTCRSLPNGKVQAQLGLEIQEMGGF